MHLLFSFFYRFAVIHSFHRSSNSSSFYTVDIYPVSFIHSMEDEKPKRWGVVCIAKDCQTRKLKKEDGGVNFHQFPLTNTELCDSWVKQSKINCNPTTHDRLCGNHFRDEDYKSPKRSHLKDDAIPSIFDWTRKLPADRTSPNDEQSPPDIRNKRDISPSKDELKHQVVEQKKKIKTFQQKLRRQTKKAKSLSDVIDELKSQGLMKDDACETLRESFSGLSYDILANHFSNKDKSMQGHRYTEEVKRFALTVHFYSPKAYEYLRPIFSLPHPRSLCAWTSSVKCDPGFFKDVFEHIKGLIDFEPKTRIPLLFAMV